MIWKIIKKVLFWLFVIFALYFIIIAFYSNFFAPKLEYKKLQSFDYAFVDTLDVQPNFNSREEIREKLEDVFGVHFYIYNEIEDFKQKGNFVNRGHTVLPIRLITISKKQTSDLTVYARVLAHELTHLKYLNVDERFTEFKVVEILYQSGDAELVKLAKWIAYKQIYDMNIDGYSCGYYSYNFMYEKEKLV